MLITCIFGKEESSKMIITQIKKKQKTLHQLKINQFSPYQSSVITQVSVLLHSESALRFLYFQIKHPYVSPDTGKWERKLTFFFQS